MEFKFGYKGSSSEMFENFCVKLLTKRISSFFNIEKQTLLNVWKT